MELHQFFLYLAIILIAARLFSEIAGRYGIPSVIGELLAGLLLGPSLLGWVSPDATMKLLAEIGIILLLFEVGMDTDLFRLAKSGIKPIVVAVVGFVLPFVLGYSVCRWGFGLDNLVSLFIGGTLTATSIGITVRVLDDLGQRQTDEAQIVIGAAVLDDILGVLALAFLYQFAEQNKVSLAATGTVALFIVLFMLLSPFVAKLVGGIIDHYDQRAATPGLLITMALALILLFSWLAHVVGAPLIMGGFAAGIALSQHFRFQMRLRLGLLSLNRWFAPSPHLAHRLEEQMRPLIHTFAPLFFVMVGVSLDLNTVDWGSPRVWQLGGALIVVAFMGKIAAGYFIRETRFRQMAIGLSMIPRGEVGLIFAQLGLDQGILDVETYAALLIVIALTTIAPPFLLKVYYGRQSAVAR
jgi:Na+:H+ antiporter